MDFTSFQHLKHPKTALFEAPTLRIRCFDGTSGTKRGAQVPSRGPRGKHATCAIWNLGSIASVGPFYSLTAYEEALWGSAASSFARGSQFEPAFRPIPCY